MGGEKVPLGRGKVKKRYRHTKPNVGAKSARMGRMGVKGKKVRIVLQESRVLKGGTGPPEHA